MDKFFHAGGPVSSKADCYIIRDCEQSVLDALFAPPTQRQYVSVLGSRQVGKTSLLYRIRAILEKRKISNAYVDLSPLQKLESTSWYNQLALRLSSQFKQDHIYQDKIVHDAPSFISFLDNLVVVSAPKKWGVIMFDEVASVPSDITNDFFPSLRELYTSRLDPGARPATRFVFLFAGSFYPDALITNKDNSPFNVSDEVEVTDFERYEVEMLLDKGAAVLNLRLEAKAIDEIWDAARGHPFLTQKICQDLVRRSKQVISPTDVKEVVDKIVNTGNHTHLRSIVGYLKDNPKYTQLLHDVIVARKSVSMHRVENTSVERIGVLVRDQQGSARMRNRIYERYLYAYLTDSSWLEEITSSKEKRTERGKTAGRQVKAIEVFYSYAHEDEALRDVLEKHLSSLQQEQLIAGWHDRKVMAGQEWKGEIDSHLNTAQIILLLVSPDFLASGYCFDLEVKEAMKQHDRQVAWVIPIILRPVDWQGTPFGKLQALPEGATPVTLWQNLDAAFFDIAKGIRKVVEDRSPKF